MAQNRLTLLPEKLSAKLNFALSPRLRVRLELEAADKHELLSETVRRLLEEGLNHSYYDLPLVVPRDEYEIFLTGAEARFLDRRGYNLCLVGNDEDIAPTGR